MLKALAIFTLVLTCTKFENNLFAQGQTNDFKMDSAQQLIVKEIERDLIGLRIKAVSEKQKVFDEAQGWKSNAIRSRTPMLENGEKMKSRFSGYRLYDTIALHQTLKSISFSDPANSFQMLNAAKERAFAGELKSIISKDEVKSRFMTNPFKETNWRYFSYGSEIKERISPYQVNVKNLEDKSKNSSQELTDIQNSSTKEIKNEILQMKRVYSEKMLKKIYDSIGSDKMDSLVRVASKLSKQKMTEDELLDVINNSFLPKKSVLTPISPVKSMPAGPIPVLRLLRIHR
jgi:hypothetical protein